MDIHLEQNDGVRPLNLLKSTKERIMFFLSVHNSRSCWGKVTCKFS